MGDVIKAYDRDTWWNILKELQRRRHEASLERSRLYGLSRKDESFTAAYLEAVEAQRRAIQAQERFRAENAAPTSPVDEAEFDALLSSLGLPGPAPHGPTGSPPGIPRHPSRIVRAPGSRLLYAANWALSPKVAERLVGQAIADMREEHAQALAEGCPRKARWIEIRDTARILLAITQDAWHRVGTFVLGFIRIVS